MRLVASATAPAGRGCRRSACAEDARAAPAAVSSRTDGPTTTPNARAALPIGVRMGGLLGDGVQERAHDERDAGADDPPVAQEVRAGLGVERLRAGLVGDERVRGPVAAQQDAAADLREPGPVERDEVIGVDRLPHRLAAPEAADDAEREL